MEQFVKITGIAAPIMRINIDTDQIIPGREIMRGSRPGEGYGPGLFGYWRYIEDRTPNPDFILNQEPWKNATILLADRNFGCGSSREPAPKALRGFGFRAVVAPSFGGIFYNNCFRNGVLPVELPIEQVRVLAEQMQESRGNARVTVDLENCVVISPTGRTIPFQVDARRQHAMLNGLDDIAQTMTHKAAIEGWQKADQSERPWVWL